MHVHCHIFSAASCGEGGDGARGPKYWQQIRRAYEGIAQMHGEEWAKLPFYIALQTASPAAERDLNKQCADDVATIRNLLGSGDGPYEGPRSR